MQSVKVALKKKKELWETALQSQQNSKQFIYMKMAKCCFLLLYQLCTTTEL